MKSQNNRDGCIDATTEKEKSERNSLKLWTAFGGVAPPVSIASAFMLLTFKLAKGA